MRGLFFLNKAWYNVSSSTNFKSPLKGKGHAHESAVSSGGSRSRCRSNMDLTPPIVTDLNPYICRPQALLGRLSLFAKPTFCAYITRSKKLHNCIQSRKGKLHGH
jgi:hypothetical protein